MIELEKNQTDVLIGRFLQFIFNKHAVLQHKFAHIIFVVSFSEVIYFMFKSCVWGKTASVESPINVEFKGHIFIRKMDRESCGNFQVFYCLFPTSFKLSQVLIRGQFDNVTTYFCLLVSNFLLLQKYQINKVNFAKKKCNRFWSRE